MDAHAVNPAISPNMTVVSGNKSAIGLSFSFCVVDVMKPDLPSFKNVFSRILAGSKDLSRP